MIKSSMYYARHIPFSVAAQKSTVTSWWVTFGDLLTLLLCFFLALIGAGTLKIEQSTAVTSQNIEAIPVQNKISDEKVIYGTYFAEQSPGTVVVSVMFSELDYNADGETLKAEALQDLRNRILEAGYSISAVNIESCSRPPRTDSGNAWHSSMGRALWLRSQVIDTGVSPSSISVRPVGEHCSVLRQEGGADGAVSIISIVVDEKVNG